MEAMEYEFLLRRVYKCGRGGAPGADADYYRKMEHAQRAYELDVENIKNRTTRLSTKPIKDLQYESESECRRIWSYVVKAINKSLDDYNYKFTKEEIAELTKATKQPARLDKEVIDDVINVANEILAKHEIHPD